MFRFSSSSSPETFKAWWKSIPLFTFFVFCVSLVTGILGLMMLWLDFWQNFFMHLVFNPIVLLVLQNYYSVFTFPYISLEPLNAILSIFSYQVYSIKKEKELGTLRFFFYFLINNLVVSFIYLLVASLCFRLGVSPLSYFFKLFLFGLWPMIMMEMVKECNQDPEQPSYFMCFPIKIKKKYHPWVFAIFFSVIYGLIIEVFVGIFVGYLHLFEIMKWTELSEEKGKKLEETLSKPLFYFLRYVKAEGSSDLNPVILPGPSFEVNFPGIGVRLGTGPAESK